MPGGRLQSSSLMLASDWKVMFLTDGSVTRQLNRKSSPSLSGGNLRGMTNTLRGLDVSERGEICNYSSLCLCNLISVKV